MLSGEVTNDSIEKSYLHVINLSLQKGTVTNTGGRFTIPVRINDSLYVSAIQFEPKTVVVTPGIFSQGRITIALTEKNTQLNEVKVSDLYLSGRLGDDAKLPKLEKPFTAEDAGLPRYTGPRLTLEERRLYTATHTAGGLVPVDAIINAISGRTKRLKEYVVISNMERRVQDARNFVNDSTYIKILNIPAKYIDDFVHYTYQDNEALLFLVKQNNPLQIMDSLIVRAKRYRKFKGI